MKTISDLLLPLLILLLLSAILILEIHDFSPPS